MLTAECSPSAIRKTADQSNGAGQCLERVKMTSVLVDEYVYLENTLLYQLFIHLMDIWTYLKMPCYISFFCLFTVLCMASICFKMFCYISYFCYFLNLYTWYILKTPCFSAISAFSWSYMDISQNALLYQLFLPFLSPMYGIHMFQNVLLYQLFLLFPELIYMVYLENTISPGIIWMDMLYQLFLLFLGPICMICMFQNVPLYQLFLLFLGPICMINL